MAPDRPGQNSDEDRTRRTTGRPSSSSSIERHPQRESSLLEYFRNNQVPGGIGFRRNEAQQAALSTVQRRISALPPTQQPRSSSTPGLPSFASHGSGGGVNDPIILDHDNEDEADPQEEDDPEWLTAIQNIKQPDDAHNASQSQSHDDTNSIFGEFAAAPDAERQDFSRRIREIETAEDLEKLYPTSLINHSERTHSPVMIVDEDTAFQYLAMAVPDKDDLVLDLDDFEIYDKLNLEGKGFYGQLRCPVKMITKGLSLLVDGIVRKEDEKLRVNGMQISEMKIENLADPSTSTTRSYILVQSIEGKGKRVWYRLMTPAIKYDKIWEDFLWLADLSKFVVIFLLASAQNLERLSLEAFQQDFYNFINGYYNTAPELKQWLRASHETVDFRKHLIRQASLLKAIAKMALTEGLAVDQDLFDHDLWDDLNVSKNGTRTTRRGPKSDFERTVVTPEIGEAFLQSFPQWGPSQRDLFEQVSPGNTVNQTIRARRQLLNLPYKYKDRDIHFQDIDGQSIAQAALTLEAVALENDHPTFDLDDILYKIVIVRRSAMPADRYQYAFVRDLTNDGRLMVMWLLLPSSTTCGDNWYPIGNELMLSDECSCASVSLKEIRGVYPGSVCAAEAPSADGFFVHSLYRQDAKEHITVCRHHLEARCAQHAIRPTQATLDLPDPKDCSSLKTYSLFSGCGLLDHSMCSTGYLEPKLAIDLNKTALLSHKTNTPARSSCRHVHRSTNAFLKDILEGREHYPDVDCLIGGCPCQGFSALNRNKTSVKAHRNCSMLANLLSYVATYLPRWGMIENVKTMDTTNKDVGGANACEVAISILVSLGYQVSKNVVRGADLNAATRRERLFICYAAPGLKLPEPPVAPPGHTDAFDVIHHLEPIDNDTIHNIATPDHIPFDRLGVDFDAGIALRNVVSRIPDTGTRRDLHAANDQGMLSQVQQRWYRTLTAEQQGSGSATLRRLGAEDLFSTITTFIVPMNSRGMNCVHPFQPRVLSLEELRRGQGLPDEFLLVGDVGDAIEQIGNGVVWKVGEGWGLSFAKAAWESGVLKERKAEEERAVKRARHQ
jgi:site-specific DNA-cytosine methylase